MTASLAASAALALGGCMQTAGPVAVMQPRADLDSMAYGQPYGAPQPVVVADGGGAIGALRNSFASSPAPMPVGYAAPMAAPVRYDSSYHLDAGDRLRRRGLRPGRPHQQLCHRCRRFDHHAADRWSAGPRPHPGGSRR
ncbi:hypothetical protein ACVW0J_001465 [Bradyrhizobium sp. i1.7.7]